MILRALAVIIGAGVLAATAHVTISHTGGYGTPQAMLTLAISAGVGIGALAIGACWTDRRRVLAIGILGAMICGELFGLAMTAERLIAQREDAQAPIRKANGERTAIAADIGKLESALSASATSPRLSEALAAQAKIAATIAEKAAERTCIANCRALLDRQADDARTEVERARSDIAATRAKIETQLATARARLSGMSPATSGTPLADRLGVPAWLLDLAIAALGALGANGLAATLLAFGAHRRKADRRETIQTREEPRKRYSAPRVIDAEPAPRRLPVGDVTQHAARFGVERLAPSRGGRVALADLHNTYRAWCQDIGSEVLPPAQIGPALASLFAGVGITIEDRDGERYAVGIAIKPGQSIAAAA